MKTKQQIAAEYGVPIGLEDQTVTGKDILEAMQAYADQEVKKAQSSQVSDNIINSLGDKENEYIIKWESGEWWITHTVIGSGEPLEQFLNQLKKEDKE